MSQFWQSGLAHGIKEQWQPNENAFALRVATVVGAHWEDHTVDLAWPNGGGRMHVPVMEMWAGADYGDLWHPPHPPADPNAEPTMASEQIEHDTLALVAYINGSTTSPIVIGFFYPEVSGMMLDNFQRFTRHVGNSFAAVTADGDHYLAFDRDGSYFGFHKSGSGMPPTTIGADYDRQSLPTQEKRGFTLQLVDGTCVRLDSQTGDLTLHSTGTARLSGAVQADIAAPVVTLSGLDGLFLGPQGGWHSGFVYAPAGDGTLVGHLTNNAAYDLKVPVMDGPQRVWTGWRYLNDGPASRIEFRQDGTTVGYVAALGAKAGAITWVAVPPPGAAPYIVPPPAQPDPYELAFCLKGNQNLAWVCGPSPVTFSDYTKVNGASGALALTKNGSTVALPTTGVPIALVEGDVLRATVTGAATSAIEWLLTLWGRDAAPTTLPDVALWFDVDPTTTPPTVAPPGP